MKTCKKCAGLGMVPDDAEVGKKFKGMRRDKGLRLREIAKSMKLSMGYICDLEHGRRTWSPELQKKYSEALGEK